MDREIYESSTTLPEDSSYGRLYDPLELWEEEDMGGEDYDKFPDIEIRERIYMPPHILGMADPYREIAWIDKTLPSELKERVREHEFEHIWHPELSEGEIRRRTRTTGRELRDLQIYSQEN